MKRVSALLVIPVLMICSCSSPDTTFTKRFPDMMTVAAQVDKGYSIYSNSTYYYSLAKKKDGWYVTQVSYETGKVLRAEKFWSAADRKYEVLPLDFWKTNGLPGSTTESLAQFLFSNSIAYDRSIYYGYDGWEEDVVDALENISNIDDTLLESLARAYEQQATDLCHPDLSSAANHLGDFTDAQTTELTGLFNKEIDTYKKIESHDPYYSTPSGLIRTKVANTHIFAWSELLHRGRSKEAADYMVKDLYDTLLVNLAKNELMCADSNSIIVADGDADTYAGWYVQQMMGYRKDVLILNMSLLGMPDWTFYWKKQGNFSLGMPEEFYRDKNRDYYYIHSKTVLHDPHAKPVVHTLLDMRTAIAAHDTSWFNSFNGRVSIPYPKLQLTWSPDDTVSSNATFTSQFLYRSQLSVMDLIASNYPSRRIYFSPTLAYSQIAFLEEGLRSEGLLISYHPELKTDDAYNHLKQDLPVLLKNVRRYDYAAGDVDHLQVPMLYSNYFYQYCTLAELYMSRNANDSAVMALDSCESHLSFEIKDPDPFLFVGMDYIRAGNKDKGTIYLEKMIGRMKDFHADPAHNNEVARHLNSINFLIDLCGTNHLLDLEKKLTDLKYQLEMLKK